MAIQSKDASTKDVEEKQIKSTKKTSDPTVDFLAGGLVSAISKVLVYPVETKVLLAQVAGDAAVDSSKLWHGVGVKASENFLYNGLLWWLKEVVRPKGPDPAQPEKNRPPIGFVAAWIVSYLSMLITQPMINVCNDMQASLKDPTKAPISALSAASAIMKKQGLFGFLKSWELGLALRMGSAISLVIYDFVRVRLASVVGKDVATFIAATIGRFIEVVAFHPVKTLRNRKQQGQQLLSSYTAAGVIQLWAGVGNSAVADAVKIGVRFLLIERVRALLMYLLAKRKESKEQITAVKNSGPTLLSSTRTQEADAVVKKDGNANELEEEAAQGA